MYQLMKEVDAYGRKNFRGFKSDEKRPDVGLITEIENKYGCYSEQNYRK